ncbi:Dynactin subunit 4 [Portunus trituberculatus]|uniref:Dynactin subunit 4 n=1 Tax=Portunus trituberculatus TaxID=210409 RepID=A0A5B7DET2_PORTR|nr:Dynactin subunit 4 [Portunus trituberculatus]
MAHLFQGNRVRLLCSCGLLKPITAIYFCRHCLKLRCGNCVSHEGDISQTSEMTPLEATAEVEGLPEDIFTEEVVLSSVTTMEQRLSSPEWQPERTADLYPLHKHILVKRSLRCRHCEHNLSKPEYNPSSIKFKIQLGAFYHVPEVRMVRQVELKTGAETGVQLSLCNPTPHDMTVALLPFVPEASEVSIQKGEESVEGSSLNTSSLVRVVEIPPEKIDLNLTADVALPQGQLILAARDDTAEYDDQDSSPNYKDDPQVVAWRRANKVGVNLLVTPKPNATYVRVGFVLRYDYTNTVATATESRTERAQSSELIDRSLGRTETTSTHACWSPNQSSPLRSKLRAHRPIFG